MRNSRSSLAGALAIAALSMSSAVVSPPNSATSASAPSAKNQPLKAGAADFNMTKIMRELARGSGQNRPARNRGPGWTRAHVQRMARKRRNVARNRAAHRG